MFNGNQLQLGAEEFGPSAPTAVQVVTQAAIDMTDFQKNVLYSIAAGVAAYYAYLWFYGE